MTAFINVKKIFHEREETLLLNNSIEQSSSWESDGSSSGQEICRSLWNADVLHRIRKGRQLDPAVLRR